MLATAVVYVSILTTFVLIPELKIDPLLEETAASLHTVGSVRDDSSYKKNNRLLHFAHQQPHDDEGEEDTIHSLHVHISEARPGASSVSLFTNHTTNMTVSRPAQFLATTWCVCVLVL